MKVWYYKRLVLGGWSVLKVFESPDSLGEEVLMRCQTPQEANAVLGKLKAKQRKALQNERLNNR